MEGSALGCVYYLVTSSLRGAFLPFGGPCEPYWYLPAEASQSAEGTAFGVSLLGPARITLFLLITDSTMIGAVWKLSLATGSRKLACDHYSERQERYIGGYMINRSLRRSLKDMLLHLRCGRDLLNFGGQYFLRGTSLAECSLHF